MVVWNHRSFFAICAVNVFVGLQFFQSQTFLTGWYSVIHHNQNYNNNNNNATNTGRRGKKHILGDGCYHVFLDLGANIGVHTRFLYEPEKYPDSLAAQSYFPTHFGAQRDNRDFCSFAFEPNPVQKERLLEIKQVYGAMGWHYHPIMAAVSDQTESNVTFHHMNDAYNNEWGFNALRTHNARGHKGRKEGVPVMRISDFLLDEIKDRRLPRKVYGNYPSGPKVIMKFDVEGLEYVTLPDLITSGALCSTVDFCFGEFHEQYFFFPRPLHGGEQLRNAREGLDFAASLVRATHSSRHCKTNFSMDDDESYLKDGMPFPEPSGKTAHE